MCGIFGYDSKEHSSKLEIAASIMGIYMEERGDHSFGVSDGKEIVKDVGAFSSGFDISMIAGYKQLIGHTRFSTVGAKTKENAHPFRFDAADYYIIACHNGQVPNHSALNRQYDRNFEVDSQHIFQHIIEGKSLREIRGYGAIAYYNSKNGQIYLGRFNGGQLAVARTSFGIVFASTQEAVDKAVHMAGGKLETFYQIEDEKMYTIENSELFTAPEIEFKFGARYESTTPAKTHYHNNYGHDWRGRFDDEERKNYSRGRYINDKWVSGKWVGNSFIEGDWKNDEFTAFLGNTRTNPEQDSARLLPFGKKARKDRSRKKKIVQIDHPTQDACSLCQTTFAVEDETWETPMGEICDTCMEICFRADSIDADEIVSEMESESKTIEGTVGPVNEEDDPFSPMSVETFVKSLSPAEVNENTSVETKQTTCDECARQMIGSDTVYIDRSDVGVKWILCSPCHVSLTTPYNTQFPFVN